MSIVSQVENIVNSMTGNNNPPQIVTIRKAYNNNTADIITKNGVLRNVRCSSKADNQDKGLLIFEDGDMQSPFVILFNSPENKLDFKLIPYNENPEGIMCFKHDDGEIRSLDINLNIETLNNGYLKIEANLIERSDE